MRFPLFLYTSSLTSSSAPSAIVVRMKAATLVAALAAAVAAHGDHEHQTPIEGPHEGLWYNTLPGDGGTQVSSD